MTIQDAITQINNVKPHHYDDATVIRWLSDLDGLLFHENVRWHRSCDKIQHGPYCPDKLNTVLMVPEPYSDVYIKYCAAQIDYHNGETDRYNQSVVMFTLAQEAFIDWFNRTHMPKQRSYISI